MFFYDHRPSGNSYKSGRAMFLFKSLAESRQEAIRDARALVENESSRATDKSELINKLHKIFHSVLCCQDLGRNPFERSYYLVVCEQIEHHISMIVEDRSNAA